MRVRELLLVLAMIAGVGVTSVVGFWIGASLFEPPRDAFADSPEIQILAGGGGRTQVIGGAAPDRLDDADAPAEPLAQAAAQVGGLMSAFAASEEATGTGAPEGPIAIDTLRVEPDGSAVIVGRAEQGEVVDVVVDGTVVAEGRVTPSGDFVVVLEPAQAADGPRRLTFRARDADGEVVAEAPPVIVTPSATASAALATEETASEETASEAGGAAATARERPVVFQEREDGVAVIQVPDDRAPGEVSIDSVTYDERGGVSIAGRGAPGANARLYLNDSLEDAAPIQPDGSWRVVLPRDVPPALYTLRVDQTSPGGVVTSRAETPFERANPDDITIEQGAVVVQPGNNLWEIANYVYGDGARFSVIFTSNRGQIRDPNLIYPGQVFTLPPAAAGERDAPR